MRITSIKAGKWYETTKGVGECIRSGGTSPPSVQVKIVHPFPRGIVSFLPKEVIQEIAAIPRAVIREIQKDWKEQQIENVEALNDARMMARAERNAFVSGREATDIRAQDFDLEDGM
jgi:hypothetical protein